MFGHKNGLIEKKLNEIHGQLDEALEILNSGRNLMHVETIWKVRRITDKVEDEVDGLIKLSGQVHDFIAKKL